jgi:serine/threonine-protein kinase
MAAVRAVGRYELHDVFASGGMAQIHLGRTTGPDGTRRVVAMKRLHGAFAADPNFRAMLIDEARLASSIHHRNVVEIIDVIEDGGELFVVMDYIEGAPLARLMGAARAHARIPAPIASAIVHGILDGLTAAHDATDANGAALGLVHRDLSPHNVIVGADGVPRILDFGIAKAVGRAQRTNHGEVKGKAGYMAPEQVRGEDLDRRVDVFATGIVFWEMLTGKRLYDGDSGAASMMRVLELLPEAPSKVGAPVPSAVDHVVLRALERDRNTRFASAQDMAKALDAVIVPASAVEVAAWVSSLAGDALVERATRVRAVADAPPIARSAAPRDASKLPARRAGVIAIGAAAAIAIAIRMAIPTVHALHADAPTPHRDVAISANTIAPPSPPGPAPGAPPDQVGPTEAPSPPPSVSGSAASTVIAAPHGATRTPPRARTTKPPSCKPPYTVEADGTHVVKPECM